MDILCRVFPRQSRNDLLQALDDAGHDVELAISNLLERANPVIRRQSEPQQRHTPRGSRKPRHRRSHAQIIDIPQRLSPTAYLEREEIRDPDPGGAARRETPPARTLEKKGPNDANEAIASLLLIFPDACTEFIKKIYKEHHALHAANIVEFLADKFLEEGYTRAEKINKKRKREPEDAGKEEAKREGKSKYDAPDRPGEPLEYYSLVRRVLRQEFPRIPVDYINGTLGRLDFLSTAYTHLLEAQRKAREDPNSAPFKPLMGTRRREVLDDRMGPCWPQVKEELEYAHMREQMRKDAELATQLDEKVDELEECQCCFSEFPFESMTHCGEGTHLFCLDCARRHAESVIGNSRYKLTCIDFSGCQAEFAKSEIQRFLSPKSIMALSKIQQDEELRVADIEGLEQCPFCDYAAICAPIEVDKEFRCQNPDCEVVSCRHCKKTTHIPLSCQEAAKEDKITVRHAVEEAMTKAMIRKCNKCKSPFIKEDGCNKMTCTKAGCGSIQCYVCSKTVKGYNHFNDSSRGGAAGNCPLFDNVEERHEKEIWCAAEVARKKLREENPDLDDEDLNIKLSDNVKRAEEARRQRAQPRGVPDYHPPVLRLVNHPPLPPNWVEDDEYVHRHQFEQPQAVNHHNPQQPAFGELEIPVDYFVGHVYDRFQAYQQNLQQMLQAAQDAQHFPPPPVFLQPPIPWQPPPVRVRQQPVAVPPVMQVPVAAPPARLAHLAVHPGNAAPVRRNQSRR